MEALAELPRTKFPVSFSGRSWRLKDADEAQVRVLGQSLGVSDIVARLLAARCAGAEDAADLLEPTLKRLLPEPLLLKDMDKAIARAVAAIGASEPLAVFGDYDVDGSASAAMLIGLFTAIGRAPRLYVPDRLTEGYGPSPAAMRRLRAEGTALVITVDCGAAAHAALDAARDCGLDVIVLDHHAVERSAAAAAIHVNPNRPDDASGLGHLCAAGVAFLFLVALNRALRESGWYAREGVPEPDLRRWLDLVGLATVCDVVPLVGVNRAFVRHGLKQFAARPGLAALAAVAGANAPFTPYHLGFVFGPRINAGGRVGRCSLGAELLSATSLADAEPLARQLDRHNRERQAIEAIILDEAVALGAAQETPFVFLAGEGWHPGVVGIVAARLKERFGKPAFVAGLEGGMGRGSARGLAGADVGEAVRAAKAAGVIEAGGGHRMAAGFSLFEGQVAPFRAFLARWFADRPPAAAPSEVVVDTLLAPAGATLGLVEELARLGPYGAGAPEPVCALTDVTVGFADVVGQNHVRLGLARDGARLDAIAFRIADTPLGASLLKSRGRRIHAAGYLRADSYQGRTRVQLQLEDAAPAGA